jgi:hypothetical protein
VSRAGRHELEAAGIEAATGGSVPVREFTLLKQVSGTSYRLAAVQRHGNQGGGHGAVQHGRGASRGAATPRGGRARGHQRRGSGRGGSWGRWKQPGTTAATAGTSGEWRAPAHQHLGAGSGTSTLGAAATGGDSRSSGPVELPGREARQVAGTCGVTVSTSASGLQWAPGRLAAWAWSSPLPPLAALCATHRTQ